MTKIPIKPADHGPGARINTSFFFTDFVMKGRTVDKTRTEDPREALLKVDAEARANPMFLGKAYESSQPKPVLYEMTFEQEQDEFRKKQKDSIDITKPKK